MSDYRVRVGGDAGERNEHRFATADAALSFVEGLAPGTTATITTPDGGTVDVGRLADAVRDAKLADKG